MALQIRCFVFVLLLSPLKPLQATNDNQATFIQLMINSLSGNALAGWGAPSRNASAYCSYSGIGCNKQGLITKIKIPGRSLSGFFPSGVCSYLPELQTLDISNNNIQGNFPQGIINCSHLQLLNMSSLYLTGKLPNLSAMRSLRVMDLSYNMFQGDFPISVTNLSNLEVLIFNENTHLNLWELPVGITLLPLKVMVLTTCNLRGSIPPSIGNMTSLVDLELSGNYLMGPVPKEIGSLQNLVLLMLYYNGLTGAIPQEFGNLTQLTDLDMSVNQFTGNIPISICRLPKLHTLQLYNNSLKGHIPAALGDSTTLSFLSLYDNQLTGEVPRNLGKRSPMILIDLSENQLSGKLPAAICAAGKLIYFLVLQNMFTGEIPQSYVKCASLIRFRVSYNHLDGSIPSNLFSLPHTSIFDMAFNELTGEIPKTIRNARNLSQLLLQSNRISGVLPPEIAAATKLVKIDLSNNLLSGPLPIELGSLTKLNLLLLQGNKFNSSIPDSLSSLKSLNVLDLSNNQLTGKIPQSLSVLLPTSLNFSHNQLVGPIPLSIIKGGQEESCLGNPQLCVSIYLNSSIQFPLCPKHDDHDKVWDKIWVIVVSLLVVFFSIAMLLKRCLSKEHAMIGQDETISTTFSSYDIKSFHRISFEQREILEAMVDTNILGHGGSGTVYKIALSNGEVIAVKKLWSQKTKDSASKDQLYPNKELETEVETLGSIRHKNIIKLYSYFSSWDCRLLVYEYMPNGNLWDALHKGKMLIDWPTRHQIALGIAQGLAYLHHDLLPPIIHRDIKSSNILLDIDYQPKVADFGVAKVLQATRGNDSSHTVIAGTYAYLDPDYVNSSKATTKCDVYSLGVVLMELVTGKKPVETEFGENKNIINWILSKMETKEGAMQVLDRQISDSFKEKMLLVLRLATRCTARAPTPRPTMNEVVQLLIEVDPCRLNSFKLPK
ncbi:hypothetical protein V2J09_007466 [Rumex salicifolius]